VRTTDTTYSEDYWQTLDGGRGYADSTLWEDIAYIVKELFAIEDGRDCSGERHCVDVGCAMGYLVKHLRRRGFDAWGLDFSRYALEHADPDAATYLRYFDLTEPERSFFGTEKFNLLTCMETLEHIPPEHAERAVQHLWDLLEPGGRALLTICVEGQPGWNTDPTHLNVVPRVYWQQLFERQGWRVLHRKARYLKQFWLFSQHKGVFVLRKPPTP
jgi:2-polyprenyl-3-methyl-5-hydroxy-6-metoxy-1,4-benzoquinol methylase